MRAHQHAAVAKGGQEYQALGRSRGGLSSKLHAKIDALGMALQIEVTGGEVNDITQAHRLLTGECDYLLADRGYDSNELRQTLKDLEIEPVIPGRKHRREPIEYDQHLYKERNFVERFFNRIKQFRRIATRYDKTVVMFKGDILMAAILLWVQV